MEGAGSKVNKEMAAAQKVAGFEYNDFEASISKFDSAFQVLFPSYTTSLCLYVLKRGAAEIIYGWH